MSEIDIDDATEVYGEPKMNVPMKADKVAAVQGQELPALISMIERAARDPSIDIDKMERLMKMHEQMLSRKAEHEFNDAMALAQAEMGRIATNAKNSQTKSEYATYAAIDKVIRPIYTKHKFSLSFDTEEGAAADHVRVVCFVSNGAYTRKYKADMPSDGKGAKGGDVMTKTHAMGAAMQYGQRYLVKGIFNLAIGTDDDGNAATGNPIAPEQAEIIKLLIVQAGADIQRFMTAYNIESVDDLPSGKFEEAKGRLERLVSRQ